MNQKRLNIALSFSFQHRSTKNGLFSLFLALILSLLCYYDEMKLIFDRKLGVLQMKLWHFLFS
jgi:hypothetical protein